MCVTKYTWTDQIIFISVLFCVRCDCQAFSSFVCQRERMCRLGKVQSFVNTVCSFSWYFRVTELNSQSFFVFRSCNEHCYYNCWYLRFSSFDLGPDFIQRKYRRTARLNLLIWGRIFVQRLLEKKVHVQRSVICTALFWCFNFCKFKLGNSSVRIT